MHPPWDFAPSEPGFNSYWYSWVTVMTARASSQNFAFYNIRPGNGMGLFFQPQPPEPTSWGLGPRAHNRLLLIVIGQKSYVHSVTQLNMHLWLQSTHITTTFTFCLTLLFFWRLLQVRLGPTKVNHRRTSRIVGAAVLQGRWPSCHPTNSVKAHIQVASYSMDLISVLILQKCTHTYSLLLTADTFNHVIKVKVVEKAVDIVLLRQH